MLRCKKKVFLIFYLQFQFTPGLSVLIWEGACNKQRPTAAKKRPVLAAHPPILIPPDRQNKASGTAKVEPLLTFLLVVVKLF